MSKLNVDRRYLLVMGIILFIISQISFFVWGRAEFGEQASGDGWHYDQIAKSLINGEGFSIDGQVTMIRTPGYSLWLAGIYKIFGSNPDVVRYLQGIIYGLTAIIIWQFFYYLFGIEWMGFIAGLSYALFPRSASIAGEFFSETITTFILIIFVAVLTMAIVKNRMWLYVLSGFLIAFGMFLKSALFFLPLFFWLVICLLFIKKFLPTIFLNSFGWKNLFFGFTIVLFFAYLTVTPWLVRNYFLFDRLALSTESSLPLFIRSQRNLFFGSDLAKYISAQIVGDYITIKFFVDYDRNWLDDGNRALYITQLERLHYSFNEINNYFSLYAKETIINHPIKYLLLTPIEFIRLNGALGPNTGVQHLFVNTYNGISEILKICIILIIRLFYTVFFIITFFGLMKLMKRSVSSNIFLPVILIIVYFNFLYSLTYAIPRYSLPIYPYYFMLFVFGSVIIYNYLIKLSRKT